jgi:hypothetical protein
MLQEHVAFLLSLALYAAMWFSLIALALGVVHFFSK